MHLSKKYFISLSVFIFCFFNLNAADSIGVIAFVKGNVKLDGRSAKDGDELLGTSAVSTNDGTCSLLIGENTVVHLAQNSQIEVQKYLKSQSQNEDIELSLKVGEVKALIGASPSKEKNFKVRSRSHIMGVRGTEIFVSAPQSLESPPVFLTLQGKAEVFDLAPQVTATPVEPKPVVLTANQAFTPGQSIQILSPERAQEVSRAAGPPPPPDRPGQIQSPQNQPPEGSRMPPRIELPFGPGANPLSGANQVPFDPTIDRKQPQVPVQIQFDPD